MSVARWLLNWKGWVAVAMLVGSPTGAYYYGIWPPPQESPTEAPVQVVRVAVTPVLRGDLAESLVVEAEFRPYQEVELHAKVAGYLDKLLVDIGDRVQEGDRVATLETPELENDLERAKAVESRCQDEITYAKAEQADAHLLHTRLVAVDRAQPRSIAQQEIDQARTKDEKATAAVAAAHQQLRVAQADIKRLKTMLDYAQILAPFSGVVTKRYADPGALIQAGTSSHTQTLPLVRLSELQRLRMVFPVSVPYAPRVKPGQDPLQLGAHQLGVMDVVRGVNEANLILPAGDIRIGSLDYNIYTNSHGYRNKAKATAAELRAQQVRAALSKEEQVVVRDVRLALIQVNNASKRLQIMAKQLEHARRGFELAKARYNAGTCSMVELNQSQLNQTAAEIGHVTAKYEYCVRVATLDFETGRNSPSPP